jgi:hypothetical protein
MWMGIGVIHWAEKNRGRDGVDLTSPGVKSDSEAPPSRLVSAWESCHCRYDPRAWGQEIRSRTVDGIFRLSCNVQWVATPGHVSGKISWTEIGNNDGIEMPRIDVAYDHGVVGLHGG